MNSIFTRRSIRSFEEREVEDTKLTNILKAGMFAPSAHNYQPWEFIVVKNQETKQKIADMSIYGKPALTANVLIVLLANRDRVKKEPLWWQQDMSACTQNILLQTVEEGLGAVWLGFYPDEQRVQNLSQLFDLTDELIPFSVVAIGYSNKENKIVDRFDSSRIHYEKY